jgi:hypothetical protein
LNSSSSSSSDKGDPSEAAVEEAESGDVEVDAAETVSDAEDVAAEVSSADKSTASSTSGEEGVVAGTSTEEDEVSMDELKAVEAAFDSTPTASASNLRSIERAVDEHTTAGAVTSAARTVETTPITITSSGGTAQGHPSESGSHAERSLLDSSPSTHHYVWRAQRGSIVSTDSERTVSATMRVPTPPSPLHESAGTTPTLVVITLVVSVEVVAPDSEAVPAAAEEVPGSEEVPVHIPDIPEGNSIVESILIDESLVISTDFGACVTHVEYAEVDASEDPIQADVTPSSDVLVIEEAFVQDPADDVSMEDMADTHDSYDAVLAKAEGHVVGVQAVDMEVIAPVIAYTSPTKTCNWLFINILLFFCLMAKIS